MSGARLPLLPTWWQKTVAPRGLLPPSFPAPRADPVGSARGRRRWFWGNFMSFPAGQGRGVSSRRGLRSSRQHVPGRPRCHLQMLLLWGRPPWSSGPSTTSLRLAGMLPPPPPSPQPLAQSSPGAAGHSSLVVHTLSLRGRLLPATLGLSREGPRSAGLWQEAPRAGHGRQGSAQAAAVPTGPDSGTATPGCREAGVWGL